MTPSNLEKWLTLTSKYHLFYQSYFPYHKVYLPSSDTFVVLIYARKREDFDQDVRNHVSSYISDPRFVQLSVLFVNQENYNLCHIPIQVWNKFQLINCRFIDKHKKGNALDILLDNQNYPKLIKCCYKVLIGEDIHIKYLGSNNPFDRGVNYSITNFIQTVVNEANITVHFEPSAGHCGASEELTINPLISELNWESVVILTKLNGYTYLSCYSDKYVSFQFYVAPFQPATWLSLIVSLFAVISVLTLTIKWRRYQFSTPVWLYAWGTLFAQCYIPRMRIPYFRIVFNIWCLMMVILSNCYTGLITTELNSPFPSSHPEVWEDLVCTRLPRENNSTSTYHIIKQFGTYVNKLIRILQTREDLPMPEPDNCFHLLSLPLGDVAGYPIWPMFAYFLIGQAARVEKTVLTNSYMDRQLQRSLNLLMPQNYHHTRDFNYSKKYNDTTELRRSIEKEVVDCGKKSVFISHEHLLDDEYQFLSKHYAGKKFYKGKGVIGGSDLFNGLTFSLNWKNSLLVRYFSYLMDTGIY
ncbi:putative glutamate receptor [Folsomia candida]|uniref:Putative glutamate receptor n=1 Tax=Folsomia candida TaxID=158441 RepID=A0A226DBH4_FOLCA|nr:putative glutamate receptor [Folsomia candida]